MNGGSELLKPPSGATHNSFRILLKNIKTLGGWSFAKELTTERYSAVL